MSISMGSLWSEYRPGTTGADVAMHFSAESILFLVGFFLLVAILRLNTCCCHSVL